LRLESLCCNGSKAIAGARKLLYGRGFLFSKSARVQSNFVSCVSTGLGCIEALEASTPIGSSPKKPPSSCVNPTPESDIEFGGCSSFFSALAVLFSVIAAPLKSGAEGRLLINEWAALLLRSATAAMGEYCLLGDDLGLHPERYCVAIRRVVLSQLRQDRAGAEAV
jgi:hypothetical protein